MKHALKAHVIFYLWKQSKVPVNLLLLLPALSSCVACVLWTKIQGRCCLLHIVITTQRDVYQSRNMQHTHNIRRERRNKNTKSSESSEIACMDLLVALKSLKETCLPRSFHIYCKQGYRGVLQNWKFLIEMRNINFSPSYLYIPLFWWKEGARIRHFHETFSIL